MEGRIRKLVVGVVVSWGVSASVLGQGQAGAFLRYGVGGRALGMGRAFVAVADDASGVYWNPAGIVGAKRFEVTSMYSNLYYDSQFAQFGFVVPRPGDGIQDKVARFLVGPACAFGFGWVGLSTAGYEQRSETGVFLGDFGISENAFLLAWAREEVWTWGILRYGLNFKFVNQNFSGLEPNPALGYGRVNRDWSGGMDVGFTFQPIHAPLFRIVSLRYLLPLRLGLVLQNVVQPSWRALGRHRDAFPLAIRWGMSYRLILRDWIPESWEPVRRFVGNSQILAAFDRENYEGDRGGGYFGLEGFFPMFREGVVFYPRVGFNNRAEGTALGVGFSMPFTTSAVARIDYAYGFHPYLPDDSRFFLTVQVGKEMGAGYFKGMSQREGIKEREMRAHLFRILSEYPNEHIVEPVNDLAEWADSTNAPRYYDLVGGLGRATWLFREAKALLRQGRVRKAQKRAVEAVEEYTPMYIQTDYSLSDDELLDYGETLIIANRMEEAIAVLEEVETSSLRTDFLRATARKANGDWDGAIEAFQDAVKQYEQEQDWKSMVCLSFLGLGVTLLRKGQYESALTTLEVVLRNYKKPLDADYPRYPIFEDGYVVDDAQFLGGICRLLMEQPAGGVASILETHRFYPRLEYGRFAEAEAELLIEVLESANWERMGNVAEQFLGRYFQAHELLLSD